MKNLGKPKFYSELKFNGEFLGNLSIWSPRKRTTKYGIEYWRYMQILGFGHDQLHKSCGGDSLQCVVLAIQLAGTLIRDSKIVKERKFAEQKNWDNIGLPAFEM